MSSGNGQPVRAPQCSLSFTHMGEPRATMPKWWGNDSPSLQNGWSSCYTIHCATPSSCSYRPQCWSCRNLSPGVIPFKLMGLCLRSVELSTCVCVCWCRPQAISMLAKCPACSIALCASVLVAPSIRQYGSSVSVKVSKENPKTEGNHTVIHWVAPFPLSQSWTKVPAWPWDGKVLVDVPSPGGDGKQTSCPWLPHKVSSAFSENSVFSPCVAGQDPAAVISAFWFALPTWAPVLSWSQLDFWTPISSCSGSNGWGKVPLYTQQTTSDQSGNEYDVKKHCFLHLHWVVL